MNVATIDSISKSFGIRTLFSEVSFIVNEGEALALVAKNGSGKSTLLKMIQGIEKPDSGTIEVLKEVSVFSLNQTDNFNPESITEDILYNHTHPILAVVRQYDKALLKNADDELTDAMAQMEEYNAWNIEALLQEIFSHLKIDFLSQKVAQLSGGQRKRISLAKFLIDITLHQGHQLLILDEPTNHLDIEMVEWLEYFLNREKRTLLLVTHDRYFLDAICTQIIELEDKELFIHRESYETYIKNKAIRIENQTATIDKAKNLYRKELEWMRRQPKARTTKSKSRQQDFYETEKVASQKIKDQKILLELKMSRLGNKIIECKNISKSYGNKKIVDNYSLVLNKGQKIGIIGKNGVGKTTFLKILEGLELIDSGEIERGSTLVFGHFSQAGIKFKDTQRVIDYVRDIAEHFPLANGKTISASQFLQLFLFDPQQQYTPIAKLSGGEKKRLHLLSVLYENPNFLILDEPTNDLDLPTLTVLENFLTKYQGCVLIVSHDRYFMDKVVDELLIFEGEGIVKTFYGTYSEYFIEENKKSKLGKEPLPEILNKKIDEDKKETIKKLSFNEKKELDEIERNLPKLEKQKKEIESNLLNPNLPLIKINELAQEYKIITEKIEKKEMRWLLLS